MIGVAAFGFASGKFEGVFDHPPDAVEAAALHVFARPVDDLPNGVAVDDVRSDLAGGEAGAACVREQVEEPVAFAEVGRDEFPVVGLLWEEADVLELGHLQFEGQIQRLRAIPNGPPLGGSWGGAPFAMGSACGFEGGFGALPSLGVARGCPARRGRAGRR